ncbi:IS4 family transposase [Sporosarcina sp. CAU 1771]
MKSVDQNIVFRQYLSLLPRSVLECPLVNYDYDKLSEYALVKSMILAHVFGWASWKNIEKGLRSKPAILAELDLESISGSQLSRRLATVDTQALADLLALVAKQYWLLRGKTAGFSANIGILKLIDSTHIKLPQNASTWTAVSKDSSGVKLHLRLAVASATEVFPEKMIPSTSNVADIDAVNYLIDAEYATYIMDRGYGHKTKIGGWLERSVDFIVRVQKTFRVEVLQSWMPTEENVIRFDLVSILTRPEILRLLEFTDKEGTVYRLLTSRVDLTEKELLDMYKSRWYIELFFKWLKQHIKLDHLFSHSPIGIWNQLFIALLTVGLVEIMRVEKKSTLTSWEFYSLIRLYILEPWKKVLEELNREKSQVEEDRKQETDQ